jgi:hypothetical protein
MQRYGHTGARTQDHSVISTALYRLSYTTSSRPISHKIKHNRANDTRHTTHDTHTRMCAPPHILYDHHVLDTHNHLHAPISTSHYTTLYTTIRTQSHVRRVVHCTTMPGFHDIRYSDQFPLHHSASCIDKHGEVSSCAVSGCRGGKRLERLERLSVCMQHISNNVSLFVVDR